MSSPPHMLSSLSIWNIRCLIMCSKYCLHFSSRLCFVTKQEIEFFPCADIVSYFRPDTRQVVSGIHKAGLSQLSRILEQDFREFTLASILLFGFRQSWKTLYAQCTYARLSVLYCTTYWPLPSLEEVSLTLVKEFGTKSVNDEKIHR